MTGIQSRIQPLETALRQATSQPFLPAPKAMIAGGRLRLRLSGNARAMAGTAVKVGAAALIHPLQANVPVQA